MMQLYSPSRIINILTGILVCTLFNSRTFALSVSSLEEKNNRVVEDIDAEIVTFGNKVLAEVGESTDTIREDSYYPIIVSLSDLDIEKLVDSVSAQITTLRTELTQTSSSVSAELETQINLYQKNLISESVYQDNLFDISVDIENLDLKYANRLTTLSGAIKIDIADYKSRYSEFVEENQTEIEKMYQRQQLLNQIRNDYEKIMDAETKLKNALNGIDFSQIEAILLSGGVYEVEQRAVDLQAMYLQNSPELQNIVDDISDYRETILAGFNQILEDEYDVLLNDIYPEQILSEAETRYDRIMKYLDENGEIDYMLLQETSIAELALEVEFFEQARNNVTDVVEMYIADIESSNINSEFAKELLDQYTREAEVILDKFEEYIISKNELVMFKIAENKPLFDVCVNTYNTVVINQEGDAAAVRQVYEACKGLRDILFEETKRDAIVAYLNNARIYEIEKIISENSLELYGKTYSEYRNTISDLIEVLYEVAKTNDNRNQLEERLRAVLTILENNLSQGLAAKDRLIALSFEAEIRNALTNRYRRN